MRLSKFWARYFIYDNNCYYKYSANYQTAYSIAYTWSMTHPDEPCFIHSTLNHATDVFVNGIVTHTQHWRPSDDQTHGK